MNEAERPAGPPNEILLPDGLMECSAMNTFCNGLRVADKEVGLTSEAQHFLETYDFKLCTCDECECEYDDCKGEDDPECLLKCECPDAPNHDNTEEECPLNFPEDVPDELCCDDCGKPSLKLSDPTRAVILQDAMVHGKKTYGIPKSEKTAVYEVILYNDYDDKGEPDPSSGIQERGNYCAKCLFYDDEPWNYGEIFNPKGGDE